MTVGAVSSSYSYSYATSFQYQFFGTVVSDERIQELMKLYGIQQSGNKEYDLQALYKAMLSSAKIDANDASAQQPVQAGAQSANVPWATLMNQVGLAVTGDFTTDYQLFNNKISTMQLSATSAKDKAFINQLVSEAQIVFVPPTSSGPAPKASGADILAQLNKMYMFG